MPQVELGQGGNPEEAFAVDGDRRVPGVDGQRRGRSAAALGVEGGDRPDGARDGGHRRIRDGERGSVEVGGGNDRHPVHGRRQAQVAREGPCAVEVGVHAGNLDPPRVEQRSRFPDAAGVTTARRTLDLRTPSAGSLH